tara:strand:- start:262 stop:777 length:516 start_codon:yes stop_codon:yes gene_type:complete
MTHLSVFDNRVPYHIKESMWDACINSHYKLGWVDTEQPEKYDLNAYSLWTLEEYKQSGLQQYIKDCMNDTDWFTNKKLIKVICNLVRSNDVHYIHIHHNEQVALYYVNLEWRDGWHGETLFYNPDDLDEIVYTSLCVPGRIVLFDGSIPHAIRPQSVKAPKFRITLSLFFE